MPCKNPVAIIGAGPAGIAAAIQLQRAGVTPLIFEKKKIGGLLHSAHRVENYPGFPNGISGTELAAVFRRQLKKWQIPVRKEKITLVEYRRQKFFVHARSIYQTDYLIVASGTRPRKPDNYHNTVKKNIFSEISPLKKVKHKKIVIIGAGDAAFDYALSLARNNRVIILNRSHKRKGLPLLYKRIKRQKVLYRQDTQVLQLHGKDNKMILGLRHRNKRSSLACDYVLYAIGREPNIAFLSSRLQKYFPNGHKKLFFIGDVHQNRLRQTAIAVGDGLKAAMNLTAKLVSNKFP